MDTNWTAKDLEAWRQRHGLSLNDVAQVFCVSRTHAARLLADRTDLRSIYATVAKAFEDKRRRQIDKILGQSADREATAIDLPAACTDVPLGFATSITAAIAYGFISLHHQGRVHMAVPERTKSPNKAGGRDLEVHPRRDFNEVLVRETRDGSIYRIASPERTLVDLVDYGEIAFAVEEAFESALPDVDKGLILSIAAARSEEVRDRVEKLVERFGSKG